MNLYLVFILAVLILRWLLNGLIAVLELRTLDLELPRKFSRYLDEKKYRKHQQYTRATTGFSLVHDSFTLLITLVFILIGGFNQLDLMVRSFGFGSIVTGLLYTALLALLMFLVDLPFSIYSTFGIEQRFGLNRTTTRTYLLDIFKGFALACCIGGPLLAMIFWFFERTGSAAWLYCWLGITACLLLIQFLAPVLIMPLFNTFTPLDEGELKDRLTRYTRSQHFAMKGIYTMDGSKRSTRLNAFFTGFGRFRRIVFFDTLINTLDPAEIVAVLAHEMGHFKKKHIFKMMAASILQTGLMLYILSLFLGNRELFAAFGMEHISVYAGLIFFGFLYTPISTLLAIILNFFSRRYEYEADAWAVATTDAGQQLTHALMKLSVHNLANLTPHPLNVAINYSHPPVLQRIQAIEQQAKKTPLQAPIPCPICGKPTIPNDLCWSDQDDRPCCRQCLSEQENCGCSDEQ